MWGLGELLEIFRVNVVATAARSGVTRLELALISSATLKVGVVVVP